MAIYINEGETIEGMKADVIARRAEWKGLKREPITYTGNIGWRMQLTNKGCKAAKMGLSQYLKHQDLMDRLNEYKLYINLVCTFITIVSMIITIALTVVNAVKL